MPTKDFQMLGDLTDHDLGLHLCRRCGVVVAVTPFINGREIHDDRVHADDEDDDLRGWTPEETTEWQRRAAISFERFLGQPLTDGTLRLFKQDMLEEGIPVEHVGLTMVDGNPQLTVVFAHKDR